MKTIIAGSRSILSYQKMLEAVRESQFFISEVVSGGAKGVDQLGEKYAQEYHLPLKRFLPDWTRFGKRAGILRNTEMGNYAEALIALWDGNSRGTQHMIEYAKKKGLRVYVYQFAL